MSTELVTALILLTLVVFLLAGFPVAFSLAGVSIIWLWILGKAEFFRIIPATIFDVSTTEIFIAAPLFIFMAMILQRSGIGEDIYEVMHKWTANLGGGLAIGTVLGATLMAAMTGIGATGVLVLGLLALPEMMRRGYSRSLALGCIPPGGALGPLIPPSVVAILLAGFWGEVTVGELFFGGFLPGLLMALLFCLYIGIRCAVNPQLGPPIPKGERPSWGERVVALVRIILPLGLIVMVLGSIYMGIATPSEASGIGAMGAIIVALIHRRLERRSAIVTLRSSLSVSMMVMWLLVGGALFARLLNISGAAQLVADVVLGLDLAQTATVLVLLGIAVFLGMLMDAAAIIFVTVPIFAPVVTVAGINPLWFGVLLLMALIAGYVTPPFGMNLFYLRGIVGQLTSGPDGIAGLHGVTMRDIWAAVTPFIVLMLAAIALVLAFPEIATWLPSRM